MRDTDKAALLDAMAREWLRVADPDNRSGRLIDQDLWSHVRALYEGRRAPQTTADRAALAILAPPASAPDGEPYDADAFAAAVCKWCRRVCGGTCEEGACEVCHGRGARCGCGGAYDSTGPATCDCPELSTCPSCGGTGRRA